MNNYIWLDLQLFAGEGAGGDGGEGAASGDSAVDAGQQRLLELGVPADKLRRRAKASANAARPTTQAPQAQATTQQAASADTKTEEAAAKSAPSRMSWDDIMADPEYNKQMQAVVQSRLKSAKASEDALSKLTPALEVLSRKYNLDPANMDYEALSKAVSDDNDYYESRALELGVPLETAKKLDQQERDTQRQQREQQRTLEQQKIISHIQKLEAQGEAMKQVFPNFNLREELKNPAFARMTSPNVGVSVEDAYYAVHRNELQAASMQVAAQRTAQNISNSIQSGQRRPTENGTSGQAPSVTTIDYRSASKAEREALKQRIRSASARGEKIYPGQ